jgi:hypothetical protein
LDEPPPEADPEAVVPVFITIRWISGWTGAGAPSKLIFTSLKAGALVAVAVGSGWNGVFTTKGWEAGATPPEDWPSNNFWFAISIDLLENMLHKPIEPATAPAVAMILIAPVELVLFFEFIQIPRIYYVN